MDYGWWDMLGFGLWEEAWKEGGMSVGSLWNWMDKSPLLNVTSL